MKVVRTSTLKLGHTRNAIAHAVSVLASQAVSVTFLCEGAAQEEQTATTSRHLWEPWGPHGPSGGCLGAVLCQAVAP